MAEETVAPKDTDNTKESKKNLILYGLVVFNAIAFLIVGYIIYSSNQEQPSDLLDEVIAGEAQELKKEMQGSESIIGQIIPMETIIVNLAGSRGNRILKVNIELEVEGDRIAEEIDRRKPQIRDYILVTLSSKTFAQVSTSQGKEDLREEIRDQLNRFLVRGRVRNILFTEFIYQ